MSIKSQKSLNDECSEIFEKSYSYRSEWEESSSCSDEEESLARELLVRLTPAALSRLRRSFRRPRAQSNAQDIDRRVEEAMRAAAAQEGIEFPAAQPAAPRCLTRDGFVAAICNIFGEHKYTPHAQQLAQALDPLGSGVVWWRRLVEQLASVGARRTRGRDERWTPAQEGAVTRLDHCKRETIVKLVSIEREETFCYVAVARGGRVGVYSGGLRLLASYEDTRGLLLAASDRSLMVYDATTLTHTPLFCITGLPNIPTCLAYQPARQGQSELVVGTERGDLTRVCFLQPRLSLFHVAAAEGTNYYFWMELSSPPHTSYCAISTWRRVHARAVRRVCFARDGDIVFSCSHDAAVGVRARHVPGKLDDYVFKVQRGVSCFHVVSSLHLLATGGADGSVRLWDTTQRAPYARLAAPAAPSVLDVAVLAADQIVVAYCANCTIHIWDLYEECLLQSVKIRFPFLGVLGKRVEFGAYCITPGPPRKVQDEEAPDEGLLESRRGSSVCQASTGGLVLQPEPQDCWEARDLAQDPEYTRFDRGELLVSSCDHVFRLALRARRGAAPPPPGDTLRARRPSHWDLPADLLGPVATPAPASNPRPQLLAPETAEPRQDIDELIEKAGLQGILDKDFVLMQGLKHDLNRKIFEMESDADARRAAVLAGAPHLALRSHEPAPLPAPGRLVDRCKRAMSLVPGPSVGSSVGPSVGSSPAGSGTPTPRKYNTYRL